MSRYPHFLAELERRGLSADDVAGLAELDPALVRVVVAGDLAPSLRLRARLTAALGITDGDLFRLDDDLEEALAAAPSRYVTDPATLRTIDRRAEEFAS